MNEEELIDRYLSATMTAEDQAEIKRLFKEDKGFSDRFCTYVEETSIYIAVADDLKIRQAYEAANAPKPASVRVTRGRITQNNLKVAEFKKKSNTSHYIFAMAATIAICAAGLAAFFQSQNVVGNSANIAALSIERSIIDFNLFENKHLMKGDEIIALENDVTVNLNDGSVLKLDKGASCVFGERQGSYIVDQKRGRVEYEIQEQKAGNKFQVLTNGLRTTVIGTRFTVEAFGAKEKVRVLEGLVKVDDFKKISHFINPGEFAMFNDDKELEKANAATGMKLSEFVTDYMGNDILSDDLEEKPYLLILQASKWDPSSRAFVFKLKKFYEQFKDSFEVIFVNDQEQFAYDYEMPWSIVKKEYASDALDLLGIENSSFPLNIRLINQDGKIFARSVSNNEWLGLDHVLDAIKSNSH
ncbi:MAG: FecR domain-containing protein [Lentisphaerales bacterium]|nr:FecR domain-containing protein [Lentisphaerales bacterium]